MHLKKICLLAVALIVGVNGTVVRGKEIPVTPNVVDENGSMSADAAWIAGLQATLDKFEHTTGIRVLVQYHAKSPPDKEDQHPGDYMRALATRLGVIQRGILMVHFADDPDWRVWIGDELTPKFVGKPGTAPEFTASGAMHEAKEAMLGAAMAGAAKKYAALNLAKLDANAPASGLHLRLQTDALVEGLNLKFAP